MHTTPTNRATYLKNSRPRMPASLDDGSTAAPPKRLRSRRTNSATRCTVSFHISGVVSGFAASFDHLVGRRQQRRGNLDAERAGGLQVDDQFEAGSSNDRKLGGPRPFQKHAGID